MITKQGHEQAIDTMQDEEEGGALTNRSSVRRSAKRTATSRDAAIAVVAQERKSLVFRSPKKAGREHHDPHDASTSDKKRARAHERRSRRQAIRREYLSPRSNNGTSTRDIEDPSSIPMPALDSEGISASELAKDFVVHSTAWRRLYVRNEDYIGGNVLPDAPGVPLPFDSSLDKPLDAYDTTGETTSKSAIMRIGTTNRRKKQKTGTATEVKTYKDMEELERDVIELEKTGKELVNELHRARTNELIANARKQVRSYLSELPHHRLHLTRAHLARLSTSKMEQLAVKAQLKVTSVDASTLPFTYKIGRGDTFQSERSAHPLEYMQLSRIPHTSRSTTCIPVQGTHKVQDDPLIRFAPYFASHARAKLKPTTSSVHKAIPPALARQARGSCATDDERQELLLKYIVHETNGNEDVLDLLRERETFDQPRADYVNLQKKEYLHLRKEQLQRRLAQVQGMEDPRVAQVNKLVEGFRTPDSSPFKKRLQLQLWQTAPSLTLCQLVGDTNPRSNRQSAFFCRRCYTYNCARHGIDQPTPVARWDPTYPVVKAASKRSDERTPVEVDNSGETEEQSEANVRRSARANTVASTKATMSVPSQAELKAKSLRKHRRSKAHGDPTEYYGLDEETKAILDTSKSKVHDTDVPCSVHCHLSTTSVTSSTWDAYQEQLLDRLTYMFSMEDEKASCQVAKLLSKPCNEVAAKLASKSSVDYVHFPFPDPMVHKHERPLVNRGNNWEHLRRTRLQRMKDGSLNKSYEPCRHGSADCNTADCACMRRDHYCDKSCSCSKDCANRFSGCRCAPMQCRTWGCPCFYAGRECDPDLCSTCGVNELPVLLMDAEARDKKVEQLKVCGNASIQWGKHCRIGLAQSTVHGWGAFALESIKAGELVYEYAGALLSQDEAERRGNVYDKATVSFLFDLDEDWVVDATRLGNKSKFANHRAGGQKCRARVLLVNGDHRIGIFATEDIAQGEEIFFDYGYSGVVPDWSQVRIGTSKTRNEGVSMADSEKIKIKKEESSGAEENIEDSGMQEDGVELVEKLEAEEEKLAE